MKIGIDARPLETGHRFRGIGTYARNLITNLAKIDTKNDYYLLTQQVPSEASKLTANKNFHDLLLRKADSSRYYWAKDQLVLPLKIKKLDVIHFLDQLSSPLAKGTKTVITVNDLFQIGGGLKVKLKMAPIKKANKIIAISKYVKNELVKVYGIDPQKIEVIYDACDTEVFRPAKKNMKMAKFGKYLLYIGSYVENEPRKNLNFLLEVFAKISKKYPNLSLVFVGKMGEEGERLISYAKKLKISHKVIFTGFLKVEKDVADYFRAAEIFVYPSLQEGFGLPALQAMACGTPVVTSNTSSLEEVVGSAGITVNPEDKKAWTDAIISLLAGNKREALIKKGLNQAKKFSWEKCAKETLKVYENCH